MAGDASDNKLQESCCRASLAFNEARSNVRSVMLAPSLDDLLAAIVNLLPGGEGLHEGQVAPKCTQLQGQLKTLQGGETTEGGQGGRESSINTHPLKHMTRLSIGKRAMNAYTARKLRGPQWYAQGQAQSHLVVPQRHDNVVQLGRKGGIGRVHDLATKQGSLRVLCTHLMNGLYNARRHAGLRR